MTTDAVNALQRWEHAGGIWRVIGRHGGTLTIGLFRCDGGEQADVIRSDDPTLRAYIRDRQSSQD